MTMQTQKTVIERRPRNKPRADEDKLAQLLEELKLCLETRFTGYIKINYSQGSIARVEKFEEILKK